MKSSYFEPLSSSSKALEQYFKKIFGSQMQFDEVRSATPRFSIPDMLDVGRRTWIERNGNTLISMFCLTSRHSGWRNIIHGGITSGMFDDIFAQYCHLEAPELFALTKGLHIDFVKPAFSDEVLLARVSKTTSLARSEDPRKRNKKLWVEGHINAVRGNEIVTLAIAKAFFILCEQLPEQCRA
jgi:acyl-coenzyme A thioesterase PaaI-like protein